MNSVYAGDQDKVVVRLGKLISTSINDEMELSMLVCNMSGDESVIRFDTVESQIIIRACVDLISAIIFPEGGE